MNSAAVEDFMWQAIYTGRKALPQCLPNPPVGCVLVRNNHIVARGYTNAPGKYHAEAMALRQLKDKCLQDVSVFVTLEPCSFHGRTPSCAQALITRQVAAVYVGMVDPDPRNNGTGIELLRNARIAVQVGVLQKTITLELLPYLFKAG